MVGYTYSAILLQEQIVAMTSIKGGTSVEDKTAIWHQQRNVEMCGCLPFHLFICKLHHLYVDTIYYNHVPLTVLQTTVP